MVAPPHLAIWTSFWILGDEFWLLGADSFLSKLERTWKHFCHALHIWLILFTLKANYIWCEGGKKNWNSEIWVFFLWIFHSENSGHLFNFLRPQFTPPPGKVIYSCSFMRSELWKQFLITLGLPESQPRKSLLVWCPALPRKSLHCVLGRYVQLHSEFFPGWGPSMFKALFSFLSKWNC